jgi:uncharacterized protein involved in oxidation of intracellular sulfur
MTSTLFILNDAPYGNERAYNALRLAAALAGKEDQKVRMFLMADAVGCAKSGKKSARLLQRPTRSAGTKGEVSPWLFMDARGLAESELMEGAHRGTLVQLADWTAEADKVLVF